MPNRLAHESSPYLLQHAHNPVDWYPWSDEALARARDENRPILLSIGYSACHWCHVMERESFEDLRTAELMNERFINIKVDREERPDIDQIYMKAVQAMTGGGGWPLTAFLTPEGIPYHGGTYYPPLPRHGMPSFSQVLVAAADAFVHRIDDIRGTGERLVAALQESARAGDSEASPGVETIDAAVRALAGRYDPAHGGFGRAPKFPQPVTLELLLRRHARDGDPAALGMAVHTLRRMAAGGMRDHLGGGFHRYSVDERWLVPHFEKMLYDNALLARAYLDAWKLTASDDLRAVAESTLDYVAADLRAPEGGFYSARDADSEGEEGVFYVWTPNQVRAVVAPEDVSLFMRCYDVTPGGNFEGSNILHLPRDLDVVARSEGVAPDDLSARMAKARDALLAVRSEREPPFRDEKILVSWSAMALRAFAEAGASWGRDDYVTIASEAAEFLWTALRPEGRLLHTYRDGRAKIHGFLDDHAALGNALLSLHAATLEARWLDAVRWLCEEIIERFRDPATGAFYDTPADGDSLIFRPRDGMDNAIPSGPSLAAELFSRAGHVFDDARYRDLTAAILQHDAAAMRQYGPAFGRMLSVLDRELAEPVEIVVAGDADDPRTQALLRCAHSEFLRSGAIVGGSGVAGSSSPLFEGRTKVNGAPAAYVCRGYACRLPVTTAEGLAEELVSLRG